MPVEYTVGQVRRSVRHYRKWPAGGMGMGQVPVLGPHVVGLGRLDGSPAGGIGKDGLRGVGVHMNFEQIPGHQDLE
jgi:hypothetical protein